MKFVRNDGGRARCGFKGDAGDCVARSIAIVSQRDYGSVYAELAELNAKTRKTKRRTGRAIGQRTAAHGIYTKSKLFKDYMARLGFRWVPTMQIGSGCKVHLADGELPPGRLVVAVSGHYTAVIDGVIHDTYNPSREKSYNFEPDVGQDLKPNQGRNQNGVWTEIGGRCVYGYWTLD